MKQNEKEIFELGKFKSKIHAALYKSDDIKELLLGDVSGKSTTEMRKLFKEHVKSHLFVDEVITETDSFIFYDVTLPSFGETTKMCQVQLYERCVKFNYMRYAIGIFLTIIPKRGFMATAQIFLQR